MGPRRMQLFVAVDQALVPLKPLQFHARGRQAEEAHAAVHGPQHRVHPEVAEHPAEIDHVIVQFQVVIQLYLQHHAQGLIKQSALHRVVVVLQEGAHQLVRRLKLLQGEMNQQLQLQNGQLTPGRVLVKFNADQGGDVAVIIQLVILQTLQQRFQAGVVKGVQEAKKTGLAVVGFDSGKAQKDAITSGLMAGAITQNPVGMGEETVKAALKAIAKDTLPKTIDTGFYWYDKTNITDAKIAAVLYD